MEKSIERVSVRYIVRFLLFSEYIIHIMVALMLLLATMDIFVSSFMESTFFEQIDTLTLISSALLMMIIKEVLWTVIKFFKKQAFGISSFLFIGVISSIREMLFIEVQKSVEKTHSFNLTLELGINALVIFILVLAYYILSKSNKIND